MTTSWSILKDELIYGATSARSMRTAASWCGRVVLIPRSPAATRPSPPLSLLTQDVHPPQGASPRGAATPDAERRQLTVLFCDLVDSTRLPGGSTRKTAARWCGRTRLPAPR